MEDIICLLATVRTLKATRWRNQGLPVELRVGGKPQNSQIENANEDCLRKNKNKITVIWGKMREVELLPTWDCEAGYAPEAPLLILRPATSGLWKTTYFAYKQFKIRHKICKI